MRLHVGSLRRGQITPQYMIKVQPSYSWATNTMSLSAERRLIWSPFPLCTRNVGSKTCETWLRGTAEAKGRLGSLRRRVARSESNYVINYTMLFDRVMKQRLGCSASRGCIPLFEKYRRTLIVLFACVSQHKNVNFAQEPLPNVRASLPER